MTRYNYKYLFEAIIIFSILTISGCGQKVSRNYGTSIDEDTSVLSAENSGNNISNSLDIEYSQDLTVNAKIYSQEDYENFINQLEGDKKIYSVYLDLCDLDTIIYLDKLLENQNIRYLDIKNGGVICVRDKHLLETGILYGISLYHVSAV